MWKSIIFNSAWFFFLIFSHFPRKKLWFNAALGSGVLLALISIERGSVDPYAWINYAVFSLLVFWGGRQFKRWTRFKRLVLDEEIEIVSQKLAATTRLLKQKSDETRMAQQRAEDIHYVYDKIKEMSQSLDKFETFLVFGEALSGQMKFQSITLALFDEENKESQTPQEIHRLTAQDYSGIFDKNHFLENKKRFEIQATPLLDRIFAILFQSRQPIRMSKEGEFLTHPEFRSEPDFIPFEAYPIFIEKRLFGILIIAGIGNSQVSAFPILTERFVAEAERVKLYEKVEMLAVTDGLTGVHVRRHLLERLEGEIKRSRKFGLDLSFLMIDVDHFKNFNDQYGHLVGDDVLRQTAALIRKNTRELDVVGRYGGEEFGVLLVETDRLGASFAAERIRAAVANKRFTAYGEELQVTVSVGCATFPKAQPDLAVILEMTDQALYEAKRQGRNTVHVVS